jgi:hypothetical protein
MQSEAWYPIILGLVGVACVLAGWFLRWFFANKNLRVAEERAKSLTEFAAREAESRKKEAELQAKDMMLKLRLDFEKETKDRRDEVMAGEKRILQKEENLESKKVPRVALGLVHYPILDREKKLVATNVTNFDIHDIARAATVFGVEKYYIIHPHLEQLMFVDRILDHWKTGQGSKFNPFRKKALKNVFTATSLEKAVSDWGQDCITVGTHARPVPGTRFWTCSELKKELFEQQKSVFLLFGTGFGMTEEYMQGLDGVLESIKGAPPGDFRHLSVRSAVSIYLDRLMGPW